MVELTRALAATDEALEALQDAGVEVVHPGLRSVDRLQSLAQCARR